MNSTVESELGAQQAALDEAGALRAATAAHDDAARAVRVDAKDAERLAARAEERLAHLERQARLKSEALLDALDAQQRKVLGLERARRDAQQRADAEDAHVARLEAELAAERARAKGARERTLLAYKRMETVVLARTESLMCA